jgi:uncharacterized coiled-coil DUF342 family protein
MAEGYDVRLAVVEAKVQDLRTENKELNVKVQTLSNQIQNIAVDLREVHTGVDWLKERAKKQDSNTNPLAKQPALVLGIINALALLGLELARKI